MNFNNLIIVISVLAAQCKSKWHSLRTAYTRYLREVKNAPSGSAAKKKKWYLADAMSFLANYAGPQRKMISNLSAPNTVKVNEELGNFEVGVSEDGSEFLSEEIESQSGLDNIEGQDVTTTAFSSNQRKKNKTIKSSAAEVVAGPMAEYLKTVTAQAQSQGKSQESEDPTLTFFKSLVPDVNKLNSRKQRTFKAKVMELLNSMLDSQEDSELYNSRGPLSVQTVYSSNSSGPPSNLSDNTSSSYTSHIRPPSIGRVNVGLPITEDRQQQFMNQNQNQSILQYDSYMTQ